METCSHASKPCRPDIPRYTLALWWSGAEYLKSNPNEWPNNQYKPVKLPKTISNVSINMVVHRSQNDNLIDFSNFSNYLGLIRSVAYVLRYIKLCKRQVINKHIFGTTRVGRRF